MYLYILLIRIAAWLGHEKARALVRGQQEQKAHLERITANAGAVWIHVASVGEFEQARPLIEQLKIKNEELKIVVTFFSPSGYEMRKGYEVVDGVLYLPFATRRNARRFIDALQPKMAIFVKYEFWPAYLHELKKRGIPTYCISSIFRPTQRFFHWYGKLSLRLLHCFTHIYVQDEASRRLLAEHGVHDCSVTGDTRFDRVTKIVESLELRVESDERLAPIRMFVEGCERVIVAGSTWPEDEELLEKAVSGERLAVSGTKLILVPHEIDEAHLHDIFNRFKGRMVKYSSFGVQSTEYGVQTSLESQRNILQRAQVLVVDQMGLLSRLYAFAHVAYIGGGFGAGIHNTIEAAVYGIPVIFGPNYTHFREAKGLIAAGAARSIQNSQQLEGAFTTALDHYTEIGAKAAAYVQSELGATERIYHALFGEEQRAKNKD